jgi:ABC-type Fe3+-citrate transport system substrate-binding protein
MSYAQLIEQEYFNAKNARSDINEHIELLYDLGTRCNHITEMGVRTGESTRAFLKTNASLRSYDIQLNDKVGYLFQQAQSVGKDAQYIKADVLDIVIEETDLLFIDTWHSYPQLKQELNLHGNKARKYLAFHDTWTYGVRDESWDKNRKIQGTEGLLPAIIRFMIQNPHWKFKEFRTNNNGLTVLERG